MEPKDPTWDDTGFGPEEQGFMSEQSIPSEPTEAPERLRVEAVNALPPLAQQEKRRKPMFWVSVAAGIILLSALLGGGFYFVTKPSVEDQAFFAPVEDVAEPLLGETDTTVTQHVPALADTAIEPLFTEPVPVSKSSTPHPSAAKPIEPTPVKIATAEPIEVAAKPVARPAEIKTTPAASTANALWVVQVFSSPSRDDADEWLQTLREKRVQDGYIVEQTLRGQPWFRVRFGQFPTREGAEAAAVNLGFRQPWIARVR